MKKNFLLFTLITSVLFNTNLFAQSYSGSGSSQTSTISIDKKGDLRLRFGTGFVISRTANQLKEEFTTHGFGDKYNASYDWLYSGGNDFYPQSEVVPLVAELALEKKISQQFWAGFSISFDQPVSVTGYDRHGTDYSFLRGTYSIGRFLTMKHKSWSLSPQFSYDKPASNFGFFGGPVFEFHSLQVRNDTQPSIHAKKANVGVVIGVRARLMRRLEWFASYRFSAGMPYGQVINSYQDNDRNFVSVLPAGTINTNHFRMGLAWCFTR